MSLFLSSICVWRMVERFFNCGPTDGLTDWKSDYYRGLHIQWTQLMSTVYTSIIRQLPLPTPYLCKSYKVLYAEFQSWPWPLTLWSKINRVPPLITHNVHVKFESDWAKTEVCILPTSFYTKSAKVDLESVSCPQGKARRTDRHTHALTHAPTHSLTQPPTNGRITISPPTLLRGDNREELFLGVIHPRQILGLPCPLGLKPVFVGQVCCRTYLYECYHQQNIPVQIL